MNPVRNNISGRARNPFRRGPFPNRGGYAHATTWAFNKNRELRSPATPVRGIFNDGPIYAYAGSWSTGDFYELVAVSRAYPCFQHATSCAAKVKADAQKVVSVIKGDKAKTQAYCEINDLGEQIGEANQKEDHEKAEALSQQVTELEKKLGPEYIALVNDLNNVDPNSPEGREIDSILAPLEDSCED